MKTNYTTITILFFVMLFSCHNPPTVTNKTPSPITMVYAKEPNDSAAYKHIKYDFYLNKTGQLCERKIGDAWDTTCNCYFMIFYDSIFSVFDGDTTIKKMLSSVVDIPSYVEIDSTEYSKDKNKVFYFYGNSDGGRRTIIDEANTKTFKKLAWRDWGIDKKFAFYKNYVLEGLNLKKLQVLYPSDTSNHRVEYIKDDKLVYYENEIIAGADAKTFKLVHNKDFDAEDKNYKYNYGQRKNRQ